MIADKITTIFTAMRKHWRNLAASFLHFSLTGLCFLVLSVEWLDRATGEDKVQAVRDGIGSGVTRLKRLLKTPHVLAT